jgi:hypothetical protein
MTTSTSFQAHRYARLGYGELFTSPLSLEMADLLASACRACLGLVHIISAFKPLAPSDQADIERILGQLERDLRDGTLLPVSPSRDQLAQIQEDGIRLHPYRLELLITVLESLAAQSDHLPRLAQRLEQLVGLIRRDVLVIIRTV